MDIASWLAGDSTFIAPWEAALRMLVACVVGGAVGLNRELRRKPAGLRTHILISLAAAVFTLITFELHMKFSGWTNNTDPIRIIEAVTAGVAFLAAGAIIKGRGDVRGLTTGANMWLAGALGVACGSGYYALAVFGTVFALIVLVVLGRLERALASKTSKSRDKASAAEERDRKD
jgi:putative Mg2+ transporter-C (MgtC) family protein